MQWTDNKRYVQDTDEMIRVLFFGMQVRQQIPRHPLAWLRTHQALHQHVLGVYDQALYRYYIPPSGNGEDGTLLGP